MLNQSQMTKIRNGISRVFDLLAGDTVIHVTKANVKTTLYAIMYDWDEARAESLVVDEAGIRNENERFLLFENSYLTSKSVTINPTDTFEIDNEIWQLSTKQPIRKRMVPLAGIQNITLVNIRKAVELNTDLTGTISYTP